MCTTVPQEFKTRNKILCFQRLKIRSLSVLCTYKFIALTEFILPLSLADIFLARRALAGSVERTPLLPALTLSSRLGVSLYLKMETMQPTGAFKLRGATHAALQAPEGTHTLTCCSTGNHGRAVAYAARKMELKAVIFMSELVPQAKVDGICALGAEAKIKGRSQDDAQRACDVFAQAEGVHAIPPFDDPYVIAGQGTLGLEILEDLPDLDCLLVPLSGGGLAAGVALAARSIKPDVRIVGVSMDRGAAMNASLEAGHPVEVREVASLADSLGGGIGLANRHTFQMCRDLLDEVVLVTEEDIYAAMHALYYDEAHVAEGASVVGIAALMGGKVSSCDGPVATILSGRNVDMDQFTKVICGRDIRLGEAILKGMPHDA